MVLSMIRYIIIIKEDMLIWLWLTGVRPIGLTTSRVAVTAAAASEAPVASEGPIVKQYRIPS
jgi:hypothetical protein